VRQVHEKGKRSKKFEILHVLSSLDCAVLLGSGQSKKLLMGSPSMPGLFLGLADRLIERKWKFRSFHESSSDYN